MIVSVGQLHSSVRLLEIASATPFNSQDLLTQEKIVVCPAESVLNVCLRCGWIESDSEGILRVTPRGRLIYVNEIHAKRLRDQLLDIIALQPAWAKLIMHGRSELFNKAHPDICQCFKEAGMAEEFDDDKIAWWDKSASLVRGFRNEKATAVGRRGEKLSFQYEHKRTGKRPFWQSIETNFSGYDLLSVISDGDSTPMQIEVKATEDKLDSAIMHITGNEWRAAQSARKHIFHVWILKDKLRLAILEMQDIEPHIPDNKGTGAWEQVGIGFRAFANKFQEVLI